MFEKRSFWVEEGRERYPFFTGIGASFWDGGDETYLIAVDLADFPHGLNTIGRFVDSTWCRKESGSDLVPYKPLTHQALWVALKAFKGRFAADHRCPWVGS